MKDATSKNSLSETPPSEIRYFFPKEEKLCKKLIIDYVFEHGKSVKVGVLKFFYAFPIPEDWAEEPVQVAFSAPKRSFKKAVVRNKLKRRMREAYRLHKYLYLRPNELPEGALAIFVVIRSFKTPTFHTINWAMKKGLSRINSDLRSIQPPT
ncbi:MAG: ribonuclease P protein component [Bacteroidota bacterium]